MSPQGDYAPLTDEPNDAEQHAFPPRTRSARSARSTRLPAQRPPLWVPDPFRRDGDYDDREGTDSGEDTACESDNEATTSSGEDKGAVRRDARMADKSEAIADDDDDEWDFTLAGLKRDRARVRSPSRQFELPASHQRIFLPRSAAVGSSSSRPPCSSWSSFSSSPWPTSSDPLRANTASTALRRANAA